MEQDKSLYELGSDQYLKGRIEYLKNKVKEIKSEIKMTEELLEAFEKGKTKEIENSPRQMRLTDNILNPELDFRITYWKPLVFNFLFENPAQYTSEQILIGIDSTKQYQRATPARNKAIKTISSALYQLNKEKRISKHENTGRKGFKWSVNEPTPNQQRSGVG